jgi:tetratricopeptide (TPR) repeat protein
MMIARAAVALGASLTLAGAAHAQSMTVVGSNADAQICYRAADSEVRRPDALEACTAALRDNNLRAGDRVSTFVNRGIVRFRLSDFDGALADFGAARALEPNQPDAMINSGITMLAAGRDIDTAVALIDRGLAGRPQRPWVGYYGRAVAHELAGRDRAAYRDYLRAKELRPGWALPQQALARFAVRG